LVLQLSIEDFQEIEALSRRENGYIMMEIYEEMVSKRTQKLFAFANNTGIRRQRCNYFDNSATTCKRSK